MSVEFFNYHINWKSKAIHPGRHKSDQRGMGIEFAGHSNLLDYPDPRRIDLRMTMRDPMDQIYVRIFNQRSATPVIIFNDLSASMSFGHTSKLERAAEIAEIIKNSAYQNSDAIGLVGFHDNIDDGWIAPLSYRPYFAESLIKKIPLEKNHNRGSNGILKLHRYLPKDHTLIFFISDFHIPIDEINLFLNNTRKHTVVPVILWDKGEYSSLPKFGITTMTDPETMEEKTILLRKKLIKNIIAKFNQRKSKLIKLFNSFDAPPFFVEDEFNPDDMTHYFNEYYHA